MQKKKVRAKSMDASGIVLDVIKYVVAIGFSFLCAYPFYYVIINSIADSEKNKASVLLWPSGFNFESYIQVLSRDDILPAFGISISRTVLGTLMTVLCSSLLAFLVTRKEMLFRKFIYRYIVITMYVGAGIIPWYLVMKMYGFQNNFLLYIIPGAISVYYMILIKTYFESLPESLEESAAIEGAGTMTIFFRIILPLSKPILATVAVYCAVGQWNSWSDNFFLNSEESLQTVQLILRRYLLSAQNIANALKNGASGDIQDLLKMQVTPEKVQMTAIVITMTPIILVYPFAQKYFTKGIMMGAVKG